MHSIRFKFLASQANSIYAYKNLREKVQRCCANMYFNQQCLQLGVIPKYARIKIPFTSPASVTTQRKSQILRVKDEIKFLYSKKDKLNLLLYKAHLNAALEWGNLWHLIHQYCCADVQFIVFYPVSKFLLSPLPSEIGDLLVRVSTSRTRKSPQGPNLERRAAGGQQSSHASSKIHG